MPGNTVTEDAAAQPPAGEDDFEIGGRCACEIGEVAADARGRDPEGPAQLACADRRRAMQGGEYSLRALFDEHQSHGCDLTSGLPNLYSARLEQYRRK